MLTHRDRTDPYGMKKVGKESGFPLLRSGLDVSGFVNGVVTDNCKTAGQYRRPGAAFAFKFSPTGGHIFKGTANENLSPIRLRRRKQNFEKARRWQGAKLVFS